MCRYRCIRNPAPPPRLFCSPSHRPRLGVLNTTALVVGGGRADLGRQSSVDGQHQPGEETILNVVAELDVAEDGVAGGGLDQEDLVVGVLGDGLGVGVVGVEGLDGVTDALVPEGLADVGEGGVEDGAVLADGGVVVEEGVNVRGTAGVVASEDGVELSDTLLVGGLESTQPGLVQDAGVGRVAVAVVGGAGVDTGGVAVWRIDMLE